MTNSRRALAAFGILTLCAAILAGYAYRANLDSRVRSLAILGYRATSSLSPETTTTSSGNSGKAPQSAAQPGDSPARRQGSSKPIVSLINRMALSSSPYLRAAATQPVDWQPFDDGAFKLAQSLDRPILLDVGGTWCHWCRVMSAESYSDVATAKLINENFIPIKVDADARPDLDRRYQQAAQVVAQESGWPLTLFLTPQGAVFAGGTYFPAQELAGRPSLHTVLSSIVDAYNKQRNAVDARAAQISDDVAKLHDAGVVQGTIDSELIDGLGNSLLASFDTEYGGFGHKGKSPDTQAIEFALQQYRQHGDRQYLNVATKTLDAMADGGIRDQLSGAFHRYTLDPVWQMPHFEIIGSLNAAIMETYLHGYEITGDARYRTVAEGIIDYMNGTLADTKNGGFYSSQDADLNAADDGSYYTWTASEIKSLLPPAEAAVLLRYYGVPDMQDGIKPDGAAPPTPSVLHVAEPIAVVARELGISVDQASTQLESGQAHLRDARNRQGTPPIDHSFFVDRNGVIASAYFEAFRVLGRADLRDVALRSVDRLLALPRVDGLLAHAYVGQGAVAPGMLDDQIAVSAALIDAFQATGERRYLDQAGALLDRTIAVFGDAKNGGFFDVAKAPGLGVADSRQRTFDDGPTLGGNPLAALTLDRYAAATGIGSYRAYAERTLRAFAGAAREYGVFASGYALAVSNHLSGH